MEKTYIVRQWKSNASLWVNASSELSYENAVKLRQSMDLLGNVVHIICDCHKLSLVPGAQCMVESEA